MKAKKTRERLFIPVGTSRNLLIRMPLALYHRVKETANRERKSATLFLNELIARGLKENR